MKALFIALALVPGSCGRPVPGVSDAKPKSSAPLDRSREDALSLSIKVEGQPKVGQVLPIHVRIRNVSSREVDVIPPLDGSDVEFRYPHYSVRILGPDGKPAPQDDKGRCGYCNSFQRENLIRLKPDEAFDPLAEAPLGHRLSRWRPAKEGKHQLTLTVDFSAIDAAKWEGNDFNMTQAVREMIQEWLARVPSQKLETTIEFDVAP